MHNLEKVLNQREVNQARLDIGLVRLRENSKKEQNKEKIKAYFCAGIGILSLAGSYVFFMKNPEYLSSIKETVMNLVEAFKFY